MHRLSSPSPAPDIQASARRLNEHLIAARADSGTWLPKVSKLDPAETERARERWLANGGTPRGMQS